MGRLQAVVFIGLFDWFLLFIVFLVFLKAADSPNNSRRPAYIQLQFMVSSFAMFKTVKLWVCVVLFLFYTFVRLSNTCY